MTASEGHGRDIALESLRGLAAMMVIAWHLTLGFAPGRLGLVVGQDAAVSVMGRPWFGMINGAAAVIFFFVLSGYVLTRRALETSDAAILVRGIIKRLPRLALPVTCVVLFSWLLFVLHLYRYEAASILTRSGWLLGMGSSPPPDPRAFGRALGEGLWLTFFRGDATFDSSLWTMRLEFSGSLVAFALGLVLLMLAPARARYRWMMLAIAGIVLFHGDSRLCAFPIGVALACLLIRHTPRLPAMVGWLAVPVAVFFAGYLEGNPHWHWLKGILGRTPDPYLTYSLAAALLIAAVEGTPSLRRVLSARWGVVLGRLSFPLYLLHVPVICSAGSALLIALHPVLPDPVARVAAGLGAVALTFLLALPLARVDRWWVARLAAWARGVPIRGMAAP